MEKLAAIRKSKGLTQRQVAKQAGISLAKISTLERGLQGGVGIVELLNVLDLYGVQFSDVWECMMNVEVIHAELEAREKVLLKWEVIKEHIYPEKSDSIQA